MTRNVLMERQTAMERAATHAADSVDDLNVALFTARTRGDLRLVKALARTLIVKLQQIEQHAITLDERFDDMRGTHAS